LYPDPSRGDTPASTQKAPIESTPFRPPFSLRASSTPRDGSPFSQAVDAPPWVSLPFFQALGAQPWVSLPFSLRASSTPRDSLPFPQAVGAPPRDSLPFFQVGLAPCLDSIIFLDMMKNEASANTISQNEVSKHTPTYLYSEIHS